MTGRRLARLILRPAAHTALFVVLVAGGLVAFAYIGHGLDLLLRWLP